MHFRRRRRCRISNGIIVSSIITVPGRVYSNKILAFLLLLSLLPIPATGRLAVLASNNRVGGWLLLVRTLACSFATYMRGEEEEKEGANWNAPENEIESCTHRRSLARSVGRFDRTAPPIRTIGSMKFGRT